MAVKNFSKTVMRKREQRDFLAKVLEDNQEDFVAIMNRLKESDFKKWLDMYVDISKTIIPKSTDVNVNVGIENDYRQLKLMAENIDDSREIEDADFTEIEKDTD